MSGYNALWAHHKKGKQKKKKKKNSKKGKKKSVNSVFTSETPPLSELAAVMDDVTSSVIVFTKVFIHRVYIGKFPPLFTTRETITDSHVVLLREHSTLRFPPE